jgi:hypothetical protein
MTDTELRKLAEAATPGPWMYDAGNWSIERRDNCDVDSWRNSVASIAGNHVDESSSANGYFIAGANPAAVLSLLNRLAALEANNARLKRDLADEIARRDENAEIAFAHRAKASELAVENERLREALERVRAAIGDRLLAKGPLSRSYGNGVIAEIDAALAGRGE